MKVIFIPAILYITKIVFLIDKLIAINSLNSQDHLFT